VTIDDIRAAAERIQPFLHRTPIIESATFSQRTETRLGLKPENLQRTGSFKARGALNAVLSLARSAGIRCVVFMPQNAAPVKVAAVRSYGGEARFAPTMQALFSVMDEYRQEQGLHFVHPFGDPQIIAGQGTVGLEILADSPDVDTICVPVGGGGLLAGVAVAAGGSERNVRVIGVEPLGAAAVSLSLAAGRPVSLDTIETIADGLAAPFAAPISQGLIERYVDSVITIEDDTIVTGMRLILERTKLLVEPAGAAAVAALLGEKIEVKRDSRVIAVLTGGNVDFEKLKRLL
jgi:threonine dehydratase